MVRPTALAVALADGLAGTALAASASAGCDVVRLRDQIQRGAHLSMHLPSLHPY